jgi:hypothetical protein
LEGSRILGNSLLIVYQVASIKFSYTKNSANLIYGLIFLAYENDSTKITEIGIYGFLKVVSFD